MGIYIRRRKRPYHDPNLGGCLTWEREYENVETYQVDVSELLETGEVFDSVAMEDVFGVTVDSSSVTDAGVFKITISDGRGTARAKLTTSRPPTTLAECYTVLNDIKAKLNVHLADLTASAVYHTDAPGGAAPHEITAADAATWAKAVTLIDEIKADLNGHAADTGSRGLHAVDDTTNQVTVASTPTTLAAMILLINDIVTTYRGHIDSAGAWHKAPDTTNTLATLSARTLYVPLQWRTPTLETGEVYV